MKSLNQSLFGREIREYMENIFFNNERYIITKNYKKRAVVMSYADFQRIEQHLRQLDELRERNGR